MVTSTQEQFEWHYELVGKRVPTGLRFQAKARLGPESNVYLFILLCLNFFTLLQLRV